MLRKREKPRLIILYNYEWLIPFLIKQSSSFILKFVMDRILTNSIDNTYTAKNEKRTTMPIIDSNVGKVYTYTLR